MRTVPGTVRVRRIYRKSESGPSLTLCPPSIVSEDFFFFLEGKECEPDTAVGSLRFPEAAGRFRSDYYRASEPNSIYPVRSSSGVDSLDSTNDSRRKRRQS